MIRPGEIVYFKRAQSKTTWPKGEVEFAGHAYGILLGEVPLKVPEPPRPFVISNMGGIGLFLLDDLAEFMGEEAAATFKEKWQEKYTRLINEFTQKALDDRRIKLVDQDGKEVKSADFKLAAMPGEAGDLPMRPLTISDLNRVVNPGMAVSDKPLQPEEVRLLDGTPLRREDVITPEQARKAVEEEYHANTDEARERGESPPKVE